MIYKFIDNNGSEITVNSLSSLQALVDSETVKENTKVKAGLRGKWTTASKIDELVFAQEVEEEAEQETVIPEGDIKSFITAEKKPEEASTQPEQAKKEEAPVEKIEETVEVVEEEKIEEEEKTEYEPEKEKRDKTYDDENVIGLNFYDSITTCLKKYFNFKDRASRSEYWYFQLLITPIVIWSQFPSNDNQLLIIQLILTFGSLIPAFAVTFRRLHDRDKSGWWVLISFIPIVGTIILFVMLIEKGTEGKNRFGDYPLKLKKINNILLCNGCVARINLTSDSSCC